jgi:hypothetical protein
MIERKIGHEYEWVSPRGTRKAMGKLLSISEKGLLRWGNGELTPDDVKFVEVKKSIFGIKK